MGFVMNYFVEMSYFSLLGMRIRRIQKKKNKLWLSGEHLLQSWVGLNDVPMFMYGLFEFVRKGRISHTTPSRRVLVIGALFCY